MATNLISRFYGPNLGYLLEQYDQFLRNKESVSKQTRAFFEQIHQDIQDIRDLAGQKARDAEQHNLGPVILEQVIVGRKVSSNAIGESMRRLKPRTGGMSPLSRRRSNWCATSGKTDIWRPVSIRSRSQKNLLGCFKSARII